MKKIDTKTASFFPQLGKSATWEDAWNVCWDLGYRLGLYDKILEKLEKIRPVKYQLDIVLTKEDDNQSTDIHKWEFTEEDRIKYTDRDVDFDFDAIYQLVVVWLITNKFIKKPRNGKQITKGREAELKELKRQRSNLTMKIYTWKKAGKDVAKLLIQKENLTKQIKALR